MAEETRFKIKMLPYAFYGIFSLCLLTAIFLLAFFSVPEGAFIILQGAIGDKHSLLGLSFVSLAVCGINLAASWGMYKKDRVASHILGGLAIAVPAIILLKMAAVIFAY
jgi:hypothetical protein